MQRHGLEISDYFKSFLSISLSLDYIVLGSDSGRIVIIEYDPVKNVFEKVHQETYGKSGCRRIVPGQYLAVDPKGRALMIGEWVESHHIHNHANGEAVLLSENPAKLNVLTKEHRYLYLMDVNILKFMDILSFSLSF